MDNIQPNLSLSEESNVKESPFFNTIIAKRNMTIYAIPEYELNSISSLNAQSTAFCSIGSGLFSVFMTLLMTAIFSDYKTMTAMGKATLELGLPICFILSGVFFWLAYKVHKIKDNNVGQIKKESDTNYAAKKTIDKKRRVKGDADKAIFNALIRKASKPLQSKKKTKA